MIHHTSGDSFSEVPDANYGQQYTLGSDDGIGPSDEPRDRGFSDTINNIPKKEKSSGKWGG